MNVEECLESEFTYYHVEEQVVVPIFLVDEIERVCSFPICSEYDDDYDVEFKEKLVICLLSPRSVLFQKSNESNKPTYHSYNKEHEENSEFADENSLTLCFFSFKLPKENFEIVTEVEEGELIQNHH
jgi:hypothetical protein